MRFFGVLILVCAFGLTSCSKSEVSTKLEQVETYRKSDNNKKSLSDNEKVAGSINETGELVPNGKIMVYIYGEIKKPDVYTLDEGARICDLVDMAGGYTKKAAIYLNLAARLNDGDQIKVLSKEEYKNNNGQIIDDKQFENVEEHSGKININSADANKLMELSGIGQSKANAIVEYRESNGGFKSISDIKNVSGIGEALYERIKEKIEI
ncbi:competence protein ComEA [Eubacterium uniforme]|uniref:Competence protein ComEA n=1 Tax=Eubacterium uniforme TaxID=39495 RepID=A0A1T4VP59_9FIRM|nr:ComEA family DNA-binding protein [Eubacterium uniforme]SKA66301.1 competence protein ComEA [Eubacterium uniforme]